VDVVVALDEEAARDAAVVGTKAAGLAAAAAAGLPVLPGWVIPLASSASAIAAGRGALATEGAPAATLTVMRHPGRDADPPTGPPTGSLVVRSSTAVDDDGRWSGAFTSYLDVGRGDLATAVRGCWASVFSGDVLDRCREEAVDPGSLRVGVLVQPYRTFELGGTARVLADGAVRVTAAAAGPVGVVVGRSGTQEILVDERGALTTADGSGGTVDRRTAAIAADVAALARRAALAVGGASIEWGSSGGELFLLQIGARGQARDPGPRVPAPAGDVSAASMPAGAERLARLAARFPGPLLDDLVLPWAVGAREMPEVAPLPVDDPAEALQDVRASTGALAATVWGDTPAAARERAAAVCRLLLDGRVADGLRRIRGLRSPDPTGVRRLLGTIDGLGQELAGRGALPAAATVWRLTDQELQRAVAGERPALRRGPGRWEPFVVDVVRARGTPIDGTPAASGVGAGQAHVVRKLGALGRPGPRRVLVVPMPLPQLAPLLWHAAGLVSTGGSSGAHLFEVARSLGVPAAIASTPTLEGVADGALVAVDGDTGRVNVLPPTTAPASIPAARAVG
jgi:phosphohistidine swiveling domain-containing protein